MLSADTTAQTPSSSRNPPLPDKHRFHRKNTGPDQVQGQIPDGLLREATHLRPRKGCEHKQRSDHLHQLAHPHNLPQQPPAPKLVTQESTA